ncbi:MAG: hypothetical protein AAB482_01895 [Patescibacteria group bacterium]|mgnify:CR=1 FL=1
MIHNLREKIKAHQNDIFWVVFAVLVVSVLVGGGLLYSKTNHKYPIQIQEKAFTVEMGEVRGEYYASKSGSKYYPLNCKAGNRITPENRVYFKSPEEAESAGYALSTTCK